MAAGRSDLELIEAELAALPLAEVAGLDEAMRYSLLAGGKRIRPRLCLAAARAAGGDGERALPAAVAIELVHTFSLVHDDLPALDDDDLRRGVPTSHVRFGEAVAVLAGDGLLAAAFRLAAERLDAPPEARVAVLAELARGAGAMIDGQYLDVTADGDIDAAALAAMHRRKTGALFVSAVGCGLAVAGLPAGAAGPVPPLRGRARARSSRSSTTCSTRPPRRRSWAARGAATRPTAGARTSRCTGSSGPARSPPRRTGARWRS